MSKCQHPYDSVFEVKVDVINTNTNIPLRRFNADYCKNCDMVLDVRNGKGVVKARGFIQIPHSNCNHNSEHLNNTEFLVRIIHPKEVHRKTQKGVFCEKCNRPTHSLNFSLN